jgi:hypothetical protein
MIGQGLGRLAFAEKLSISQLEQALENRTIPAYIGVPLLEEKVQMKERMMAAQAGMAPPPQMTIEEEVLARANQAEQGIDQLPVEMPEYESPEYATGGIVAFSNGGETTPFGRSAIGRFAGSVGDYVSEREEVARLRRMLKDRYERQGSVFPGAFMEQPVGAMAEAQKMVGDIYRMDLNQLRQLAELEKTRPPGAPVSPISSESPVVPVRVGAQDPGIAPDMEPDNRALLNQADAALRSAPPDTGIAPPETPAAPMGAPQVSVPSLIGRAEQLYGALYGDKKPETPKEKNEYLNQAQEFFTQAGVDLNLASKQAEEVARQKADLEGDRREAKKFGVISAGLAILAGDPANSVAENIGKGLGKGMEQYTSAIKDIKKTEREMQALERSLSVAQNQSRMGLATVAAGDYQAAQKRYDDLNKDMRNSKADLLKAVMSDERARQVVEAQMRSKPSQYSEIREDLIAGGMTPGEAAQSFLGATKTGRVTPAIVEKEWGDMKQVDKLRLRNQGINTVEDYMRYRLGGGSSVGGAAPGAAQQGKVIDFSSIR